MWKYEERGVCVYERDKKKKNDNTKLEEKVWLI